MKGVTVFVGFLLFRILSVFLVKTWFVADEYWQSLEVGHHLAFGYGHLTWEWTRGIRSYIHPVIIAGLYKALAYFSLDQVELLIIVPRIFQAMLTAFADYRFYKWSNRSKWSLFMIFTSWFWFYTGSRTLGNTVEAAFTIIALSYFPWHSESNGFLWWVALICFIRPTAAITWLPLCLHHIRKTKYSVSEVLFKRYLLIGLTVGAFGVAVDYFAHGSLILTPIEFLKYNVFHGVASNYGTHPWHWYFSTGLPTILGITTLPFLLATVQAIRNRKQFAQRWLLLKSIVFTLVVYSFLPHKEFRFILPLLPICLYISADYISQWTRRASYTFVWFSAIALLVANALPAYYLSTVHQRGTIEVMPVLAKLSREYRDENGQNAKLLFLMPCHSTPYYSHIHQNVTMRFLTCEPNFKNTDNYLDEADQFHQDPAAWLRSHIPVYPKTAMPTHLVFFDTILDQITDFLKNYQQIHSIVHTEMIIDRNGNNVLVYERINPQKQQDDIPAIPSPQQHHISGSGDHKPISAEN